MSAGRPVAARANLAAFSIASAPELNRATLPPGMPVRSTNRSASSTYGSYGITEKSVCETRAAWRCTASTTLGWE